MAFSFKNMTIAATALACAVTFTARAEAAEKTDFRIAWTIYAGWMPWPYAQEVGIVKKWADKYGLKITLVQVNDYVESVNQYTAGKFDGVTVANMDALTIPAAGGVDTTALLVGDYSNGNDGVVLKKATSLKDIKGQKINLVELSVSHYLLARALDSVKLSEKDVKTVNTSDADIVGAAASPHVTAVVTWNPQLSEVLKNPEMTKVFDSSKIPGEIMDLTVVNSRTLKDNPKLGKALAGAWYETMALMTRNDEAGKAARAEMAKLSGTDLRGFESQLKTTFLYADPKAAAAFTRSPEAFKAMDLVRSFSFEHHLLGDGAQSKDAVGISFPGGKVLGDTNNVKLRFDDTYEQLAADGKL
ncbi:ABC transporter substrate-binding protein [Granulibacter bethesdensis]|uniref:putative urea ABC transporter substrate-binding protein n=1 Tax=Granulibacter bethesdensis TaxID=364410 RepID=UPI00090B3DFF|nr:putative urea ABC transporter substrate-binding protein [Granulibacter bethesdensis]APH57590.1 ABC transporter substrate-binding protein [Granulibacter bethesdensis]